jgi:hypothetical protein
MFKSFLFATGGNGWVESILRKEELGGPPFFQRIGIESIPGEELI